MAARRRIALALLLPMALTWCVAAGTAEAAAAPGGPGDLSRFDLARKDCVGTAAGTASKVWYTVAGGMLSDVYEPTIDNTNVQTMQFAVTDGSTFTELQARDTTYTVDTDGTGMTCTITSKSKQGRYTLTTTYVTDPVRDAVVVRTRIQPAGLRLFVRLDATVNGNGGGGPANGGADSAVVTDRTPVLFDENTVTNAAARDYAVPTYLALRGATPFRQASVGYAGTASDGAVQLDTARALTPYDDAPNGNVVATAQLATDGSGSATFALGFGRTRDAAVRTARTATVLPFPATQALYEAGWKIYDALLKQPPRSFAGLDKQRSDRLRDAYWLSANVIKASEDKTFPGAVVASLASPWGQAVSAGDSAVYFGSYREVFARDLYEAFTGFLVDGDLATARATARFLLQRQQLPDGRIPRNSLLNGKLAPDSGGDQLDETAYPILMAYQAGVDLWDQVRKAADFLVAHGPAFGVERWEEQSGYSPSTIAAEIAGLVAGAEFAVKHGDQARARVYRATADHFARSIKGWAVTTSGPYASRYFIRLSRNGDPNAADNYNLGNGGPTEDQRRVIDAGFLELTRLGILPAGDPDITASLSVVDNVIKRTSGFYRYGSDTTGTEDGYGDCYEPDPTSCSPTGRPWPTGNTGSGHVWPVLSGERAEQALQTGDARGAAALLSSIRDTASGTGLVPEQAWENPPLAAAPYGSDPATASIGFETGKAAGSASPLTWAQAQQVRLTLSLGEGKPLEQPAVVRARYVAHGMPAAAPLTLDDPVVSGSTATVTGTTAPRALVEVAAAPTDIGAATNVLSARAGADGRFSVSVPIAFGTNVLTVTATDGARTGYAQRSVVGDIVGGTVVLDVADPDGDDNGPGTYAYPTSADFHAGAFDLQRFRVVTDDTTVYLQAVVRDLSPTFGNQIGAQLLDVYVQDPAVSARSTAAAFPQRNYSVDAWTQRVEVQGFAAPVWTTATGTGLNGAAVRSSGVSRTITVALPKGTFGTPAAGWRFAVVLTGQDGFSSDQARSWAATPQPFNFGVCAPGGTSPICAVDPGTVPKAMDVITPAGTSQATELDPTRGAVNISAVTVP
ncbi:hypothetical protein J5X84_31445 [Streptosporangiaceae bacterium NEAU-GS5]|nr:hypothetical protein [Streptosporangiaceae bacterium NEAU-GS5]